MRAAVSHRKRFLVVRSVVGEVVVDEALFGFKEVGFEVVVATQFVIPVYDVFFVADVAIGNLCPAHKFLIRLQAAENTSSELLFL